MPQNMSFHLGHRVYVDLTGLVVEPEGRPRVALSGSHLGVVTDLTNNGTYRVLLVTPVQGITEIHVGEERLRSLV